MHKFQLRTLKVMMTSRQGVNKQHMSLRCHCQVTVTEFDNIFIDLHADPALDGGQSGLVVRYARFHAEVAGSSPGRALVYSLEKNIYPTFPSRPRCINGYLALLGK